MSSIAAGGPLAQVDDVPRPLVPTRTASDLRFRGILVLGVLAMMAVLVVVLGYLSSNGWKALVFQGPSLLWSGRWSPTGAHISYGIGADLATSLLIGVLALAVAVPVSIATALMINEYAPQLVRRVLITLVDLIAVIPGIVFGIWGLDYFSTRTKGLQVWMSSWLSFFPPFRTPTAANYSNSIFVAGIVVGIMILPVVTSVSREVMAQAPRDAFEGALALGGTRWGAITDVILPFARGGIIGAALLGLGRAMGETIAVVYLISFDNNWPDRILGSGGTSIPALIANRFTETQGGEQSALTLAGLALFLLTMIVSLAARSISARYGELPGSR